jgi:hypothetical protein
LSLVPLPREVPGMAALGRVCLVLVLAGLATAVAAQSGLRSLRDAGVTVYFQERDERFAVVALEAAVAALPTLEVALLESPPRPDERPSISIQVVRSMDEFNRIVGQPMKPWTQGVALPGRRIVVQTLAPVTMKVVVAHELTHVILDEVAERLDVEPPRWLHEGLAKLSTQDFTENDREVLGQAVREGRLIRLADLETAFGGNREQVALAYAESYTLVRYLYELQPGGGLGSFLKNLALTGEVNRALLRTYGKTAAELEAAWLQQVRDEYRGHGWDLVTESLIFAVMALLFVVVYLISLRRRREIRERLQEEDHLRRMFAVVDDDDDDDEDDDEEPELQDDY